MKFLLAPTARADERLHVVDAPTEDAFVTFARKRFGRIAWWCGTADEAIEDIQVRLDGTYRQRPIDDHASWGAWS